MARQESRRSTMSSIGVFYGPPSGSNGALLISPEIEWPQRQDLVRIPTYHRKRNTAQRVRWLRNDLDRAPVLQTNLRWHTPPGRATRRHGGLFSARRPAVPTSPLTAPPVPVEGRVAGIAPRRVARAAVISQAGPAHLAVLNRATSSLTTSWRFCAVEVFSELPKDACRAYGPPAPGSAQRDMGGSHQTLGCSQGIA
jgi:hypothetical protein